MIRFTKNRVRPIAHLILPRRTRKYAVPPASILLPALSRCIPVSCILASVFPWSDLALLTPWARNGFWFLAVGGGQQVSDLATLPPTRAPTVSSSGTMKDSCLMSTTIHCAGTQHQSRRFTALQPSGIPNDLNGIRHQTGRRTRAVKNCRRASKENQYKYV